MIPISVRPKFVERNGFHWVIALVVFVKYVMFPLPSDERCLGVVGFDFSVVFVELSLNRFHN